MLRHSAQEDVMRKTLFGLGAATLIGIGFSLPASAQMCGPGQQAQASTPAQGGMMCGGMAQAADDPMANKPAQAPQASGMCPCCKNMAMMRGPTGGGGMQHHNMPGMEMPRR
jgi:hypothetical protein